MKFFFTNSHEKDSYMYFQLYMKCTKAWHLVNVSTSPRLLRQADWYYSDYAFQAHSQKDLSVHPWTLESTLLCMYIHVHIYMYATEHSKAYQQVVNQLSLPTLNKEKRLNLDALL